MSAGTPPQTLSLVTEWEPHVGQVPIMLDGTRFRVVVCGRRWGKSEMGAHIAMKYAWENPGAQVWWVAPTYDDANEYGFDKMYPHLSEDMLSREPKWSKARAIYLINGSVISFRTSDRMSSLRGPGLDFLIIDECADVPREAWTQELRPTLSDHQGDALFIGTPGGRNWFYEWFQRGQVDGFDNVASWQAPTYQNPHIEDEEVDAARNDMTDREWKQEYLAQFIDDAGGVFIEVQDRNVLDYEWEEYDGEPPYVHGWDFARHQNWTVGITLDADGFLVNYVRKQQVRWGEIRATIAAVDDRYPGIHQMDASRDESIVEDMEDEGLRVEPVSFSREKNTLIDNLAVALENREVVFPHIDQLVSELQVFEYQTTPSGNIKYGAPEDWHDDCVDALALANREPETGPKRATWGSR